MYLPRTFALDDPREVVRIATEYPFATIVTSSDDGPVADHVPLLVEEDGAGRFLLSGHFARANPHFKLFQHEKKSLVVFQGPHAYVSPSTYEDPLNVPTWNYVAVHAYGTPVPMTSTDELRNLLSRLVTRFEADRSAPWKLDLPEDFMEDLTRAIVGFTMRVERFEAKLKLSQNRSEADARGARKALAASIDPLARDVAAWMERVGVGR